MREWTTMQEPVSFPVASEKETLALMTRIWSQIAFHVVPDETWRKPFRPAGMPGDKWISREAENIAEDVFRQLEFKR